MKSATSKRPPGSGGDAPGESGAASPGLIPSRPPANDIDPRRDAVRHGIAAPQPTNDESVERIDLVSLVDELAELAAELFLAGRLPEGRGESDADSDANESK
jgi:hypothetical protein